MKGYNPCYIKKRLLYLTLFVRSDKIFLNKIRGEFI